VFANYTRFVPRQYRRSLPQWSLADHEPRLPRPLDTLMRSPLLGTGVAPRPPFRIRESWLAPRSRGLAQHPLLSSSLQDHCGRPGSRGRILAGAAGGVKPQVRLQPPLSVIPITIRTRQPRTLGRGVCSEGVVASARAIRKRSHHLWRAPSGAAEPHLICPRHRPGPLLPSISRRPYMRPRGMPTSRALKSK